MTKSSHTSVVSLCSLRDGNLQDIVNRGSLHEFLVSLHQEFGPVASFWFGGRPVVSLGSLQQLRQHVNPNHSSMCTSSYHAVWIIVQTSQRPSSSHDSLCSFFSADSFETMLKSLLGYQSGMGGGPSETVLRKKVYESAINNTLENNFPLVLKV